MISPWPRAFQDKTFIYVEKGFFLTPTLTLPRPRDELGIFDKGEGISGCYDNMYSCPLCTATQFIGKAQLYKGGWDLPAQARRAGEFRKSIICA